MGDDTRQDRAFSIAFILAIQKFLEEDLLKCQSMEAMLNVSLHGVFLIADFCGGLRGEDLPLLSLDASDKYLSVAQPRSPELEHVCMTLRGRVKGGALEEACHLEPLSAVTASGLHPPRVGTKGRGDLCKFGYHKWLDVLIQERRSREDGF
jgi:hypothetical protein